MAAPDSNNPPTTQHDNDLTLNRAPSADFDVVPDLSLKPEADSSSTLAPTHVPLEDHALVAPDASTQTQPPGVDIFVAEEADRSWLTRLRSLKASWEKEHTRRRAHEPATVEERKNVEKHLASLAALRDVCTSIDQRLVRVEDVSGERREVAAIGEALRDLCSQTYERLVRIEAAVQRTEEAAADKKLRELDGRMTERFAAVEETLRRTPESVAERMLPDIERQLTEARVALQRTEEAAADKTVQELDGRMAERFAAVEETLRRAPDSVAERMLPSIERQLTEARMALQRTEDAVADRTLHDLCQNIDARLERTEGTLHHNGGAVTEGLQELTGRMTERFVAVEETLRLTPKSVADRMLPNLERQLMQARMSLQRTEEAVTDKALHELCQNINARLERTEDSLHRSESIVAEGLQALSARITARIAEAEEAIQRIERIVSSRAVEETRLPTATDDDPVYMQERAQRPHANRTNRPFQLPWMAGLVMPVLVLVVTLAIAGLIKTNRAVAPEKVVPLTTSVQTPTPTPAPPPAAVVPIPAQEIPAPSTTALMANAPRSTRGTRISTSPLRTTNRESAPAATTADRGPRFVGTLSITSEPSGASVLINGKPAGKTPLRLPRQRAGSLAVQIAHEGFERWSAAVLVPADQLTQVTAKLRATAR